MANQERLKKEELKSARNQNVKVSQEGRLLKESQLPRK